MADSRIPTDYIAENKRRREALEREEKFLRDEVIGQGADQGSSYQNIQGDMERAVESADDDTTP